MDSFPGPREKTGESFVIYSFNEVLNMHIVKQKVDKWIAKAISAGTTNFY
jgi:hypothetical protein